MPLPSAYPVDSLLLTPSPREISRTLLARRKFLPAETLNLLAAAWIQFQTHDWFNHGEPPTDDPHEVPLGNGGHLARVPDAGPPHPTRPDTRLRGRARRAARDRGFEPAPPTYVNAESHWWDASQIYGSNPETLRQLRTDRKRPARARRQALPRRRESLARPQQLRGRPLRVHRQLVARASASCTPSSPASTTRSATGSGGSIHTGPTSRSSTWPAWSTRP